MGSYQVIPGRRLRCTAKSLTADTARKTSEDKEEGGARLPALFTKGWQDNRCFD